MKLEPSSEDSNTREISEKAGSSQRITRKSSRISSQRKKDGGEAGEMVAESSKRKKL